MTSFTPSQQPVFILEPATSDDIDGIVAIENRSYASPWSRKLLLGEIQGESFSYVYIARLAAPPGGAGKVIGYNFFWVVADEVHILNIAVDPDYRHIGCGKRLMECAIQIGCTSGAASVLLEVRPSNTSARQLYAKLGFHQVGLRKKYYADNKEDAYLMRKTLLRVTDEACD